MSPNGVEMAVFFPKKLQELPSGWALHLQALTHVIMLRSNYHTNGIKMLLFSEKIARIVQRLGASPPGPHARQKRSKCHPNGCYCFFFSEKIEEMPSKWRLRHQAPKW